MALGRHRGPEQRGGTRRCSRNELTPPRSKTHEEVGTFQVKARSRSRNAALRGRLSASRCSQEPGVSTQKSPGPAGTSSSVRAWPKLSHRSSWPSRWTVFVSSSSAPLRRALAQGRAGRGTRSSADAARGPAITASATSTKRRLWLRAWLRRAENACSMLRCSLSATIPLACSMTTRLLSACWSAG